MVRYDKLWVKMREMGLTKNKLNEQHNVSKAQLSRLHNNKHVTTNTLDRLCNLLRCDISDIVEHIHDDNLFSVPDNKEKTNG